MIDKLILKNRSYRRFYEDDHPVRESLESWVNLARISPSGGNIQPLRFYISNEAEINDIIFPALSWAGYLKDWKGPTKGERPAAYIIILADPRQSAVVEYDAGIAAQSILLGAVEEGYGGCIVGSIRKKELIEKLGLPNDLNILLILALGKPREEVVLEEVKGENFEYWRDEEGIHHVPKRKLRDIILNPKSR